MLWRVFGDTYETLCVSLSVSHLFFFVENNREKSRSVLREGSGYDDFSTKLPRIGETAASTGRLCTRGTTRPTDIRSYIRGNIAMERDMGTRRRRRRGPRADSLWYGTTWILKRAASRVLFLLLPPSGSLLFARPRSVSNRLSASQL